MGFFWKCPACEKEYTYNGIHLKKAGGKCSNEKCSRYKKITKIYQYRVIKIDIPNIPKKVDNIPEKVYTPTIREDVSLGADLDRTVLIAGLMDTIKIYKNKFLDRDGKILPKANSHEGKKVLEWVEMYDSQKAVPMLVVHQA
ncbi:unnamed protein product, partial [marine sediment metagenome]